MLEHPVDVSCGNIFTLIPEWNLHGVAESGPDFLLNHLAHRATTTLFKQYSHGMGEGPGDHAHITTMERTTGLRHTQPFDKCFSLFSDETRYGTTKQVTGDMDEFLDRHKSMIGAGLCIPRSRGELVILRQIRLIQALGMIIDDILEEGSQNRDNKSGPKGAEQSALTAPPKPSTVASPKPSTKDNPANPTLSYLIADAQQQNTTINEYYFLLCTDPSVLAHAVNLWFSSRPQLVADERGRRLPAHTDRDTRVAVLEAVHGAVQGIAIWSYICRLLKLLKARSADSERVYRVMILQEISNICHLEFSRAQAVLRRQVSTGTGSKVFQRQSGAPDKAGNVRLGMRGKIDDLAATDPQLRYILRLCQPETNVQTATEWLNKLADHNKWVPGARARIAERETDALNELAVVVSFVQDLSSAISMPPLSRTKGQMFVSRSQELEVELNGLKDQADLLEFGVPIDKLLEPDMAERALSQLDKLIVDRLGTRIGILYEDLVEDCCALFNKKFRQLNPKANWTRSPFSIPASAPLEQRVEQRRQKLEARSPMSSLYEIGHLLEPPTETTETPAPERCHSFTVCPATMDMFSVLRDTSLSRDGLPWADFKTAMEDVGFEVVCRFGSVYTFVPPDVMGIPKRLVLCHPHGLRIEGYRLRLLAVRMKSVYGWMFRQD